MNAPSPAGTAITLGATATALLKDGSHIQLRPVTPDDKPLIADGFSRLSARARYLRFLVPSDRLSTRQLAYLAEVDHHNHVAWGVLDGDASAGIGRWVRLDTDPSAADVAITVLDDYQGRGIGRLLLQVLAVSARARGVGVLHFDVLAENEPMKGLLASVGSVRASETEIVHHVLDVARVPAPDVVEGDLLGLLEDAARASGNLSQDRVPS
ncbi:MAG: GNAT family N-acetyltransferase [Acidimicrobiia bacterium]